MTRTRGHAHSEKPKKTGYDAESDTYSSDAQYLLWSVHLKATPGRVALLEALIQEHDPISADDLRGKLSKKPDRVSVYRALDSLTVAGLVSRIDISKDHVLYEMFAGRKHHHHAVCTSCGRIEDILGCDMKELVDAARRNARGFSRIEDHSLEFFGICKKCEVK